MAQLQNIIKIVNIVAGIMVTTLVITLTIYTTYVGVLNIMHENVLRIRDKQDPQFKVEFLSSLYRMLKTI